jgi:putative addiction module component (TIGR02574 family)
VILDTLGDVQALSPGEKAILAQELLDELNAPLLSESQDKALLSVLNERYESYLADPASGRSREEVKEGLRDQTDATWQK